MRRLIFSSDAINDIERLLNFRRNFAPETTFALRNALLSKITGLCESCELGLLVADNIRETYVKFGKARFVFRYEISPTEVLLLRVWSGKEERV